VFDLIIKNGFIVDGTGRKRYKGDVGINKDKISAIGDLSHAEAEHIVDATDKIVSPGFIDMHTHSDFSFIYDPLANGKLYSGVTTEVIGNCGIGPAPMNDEHRQLLKDYLGTRLVGSIPVELKLPWNSFADYLDEYKTTVPTLNIAPLLAQGVIRIAVKGFDKGPATPDELKEMQRLTAEAMEQGAIGLSTGLVYLPGAYTEKEEIAALCKAIKPYGGVYATHIRTESDGILEALDEALWIAREADVPVEVSHLKLLSQNMLGRTADVLEKFQRAIDAGTEVNFDTYPYTAGLTALSACLPPWIFEGGTAKMLERLHDKEIRSRVAREIAEGIPGWQNFVKSAGGWKKFYVSSVKNEESKIYEGKFMTEVGEMQGKTPDDAAFDLLIKENGRVQMNYFAMKEEDVITFLKQAICTIGSDAMSLNTKGVLNFGKPHPRAFGTPTEFLGKYVRDKKILPLEEAIRKMTGMSAKKFNLNMRGEIRQGYYADITVFDADKINARATYEKPQQYSVGVEAVVVNGKLALENGVQTGSTSGRVVGRNG